jgi:ribosomal protein S18 acetylase RimI-like enzyme
MTNGEGLVIRPAVAADLPRLLEIDREVRSGADQPAHAAQWLDPDPAAYLRDWVARGECFVATVGGEVAGFAILHYHFFHSGMIDLVIVRKSQRRLGAGRELVRHLASRCTSPKVWISTNLSNTPMQALIAAEGFRMCGFIEGLDEGDPELVFSKPAKPGNGEATRR